MNEKTIRGCIDCNNKGVNRTCNLGHKEICDKFWLESKTLYRGQPYEGLPCFEEFSNSKCLFCDEVKKMNK